MPADKNFDPFSAFPIIAKTSNWNSAVLLLVLPAAIAALVLITTIEGTRGSIGDLNPIRDFLMLISDPKQQANTDFMLLRDFTNLYLVTAVCLTIPLLHWQWRCMRNVLPSLMLSPVIKELDEAEYSWWHCALGIRFVVGHGARPLVSLTEKLESSMDQVRRASPLFVAVAFLIPMGVALGQYNDGVFLAYAGDLDPGQMDSWSQAAYDSWWAGFGNPLGFTFYYLLLATGVWLVVVQCIIGLLSVWALLALPAVAELDLDWTDRDGNFGWASVSRTYRTVILSLILHGTALSISLIALGTSGYIWGISLILLWAIMLPSVTIGPMLAFRGLSRKAQDRRIDAQPDLTRSFVHEIRSCKAKPLRLTNMQLSAIFVAFILPVTLTIMQIYFVGR